MATFEELTAGPTGNSSARDRLSPASYTSPGGVTFDFLFDDLARDGSKKASVSEIIDSNSSVSRDQGNTATKFPFDLFFAGKDYDLIADQFFLALSEKHTPSNPGILNHPRWGSINVFPLSWNQKESFVSGAGRANFTVSFLQVFDGEAPVSALASLKDVENLAKKVKDATEDIINSTILSNIQAASDFAGRLTNSFGGVVGIMQGLAESQKNIIDEIDKISDAFDYLINDVEKNTFLLASQTQLIMELPAKYIDKTLTKVNSYSRLFNSLLGENQKDSSQAPVIQKNSVVLLETLAGYSNSQLVVAAINTDFQTRSQAVQAIEAIDATYNAFLDSMNENSIAGNATNLYSGDHNFLSALADLNKQATALLLETTFSLAAEKRITLTTATDSIIICDKYYDSVEKDTVKFFADTNYLTDDEFVEIPAGREFLIYG